MLKSSEPLLTTVTKANIKMWKSITLLAALLCFSATANAQVAVTYVTNNKALFTMEIPDTWIVNVGTESDTAKLESGQTSAPRVVTAMPEDGTILWFGTWVPDGVKTLDDAHEYLLSVKDYLIDEATPSVKITDAKIGRMPVRYSTGTGIKNGKKVDYFAMLFQLNKSHSGLAIYIGPEKATDAHREELKSMVRSIKPVR